MAFATNVILYNCKINHNGLFGCDFGGSGSTRDSVMGSSNNLATIKFTMGNCSYIRKDKVIMVDRNADVLDAAGVNYCRYINPDYSSDHYFYAFVESIEYVAPQTSRLHIRTDCFMTYFHKIIPNECFVEREHVLDDRYFAEVMPENVGGGELFKQTTYRLLGDNINNDETNYYAAFNVASTAADLQAAGLDVITSNYKVGGSITGTFWYGVEILNVTKFSDYLVSHNITILSITQIPKLASLLRAQPTTIDGMVVYTVRDPIGPVTPETCYIDFHLDGGNITYSGTIGPRTDFYVDVTPLLSDLDYYYNNRKIYTYPFMAFELFTHDGGSTVLIPQDTCYSFMGSAGNRWGYVIKDSLIGGSNVTETADVAFMSGGNYETYPMASMSFSRFPTISVSSDSYAQFVARNENAIKFQKAVAIRDKTWKEAKAVEGGIAGTIGSVMQGSIKGAVDSLANAGYGMISAGDQVDAIEAKMRDQRNAPDGTIGQPSDGTLYELNKLGVYFGFRGQSTDNRHMADQFFDRYGYRVNRVKMPQWNSRPKFNYVKTAGANISGEIPENDKEIINNLLDTGLTVWHAVGDYGVFDGRNNLAPLR